VTMLQEMPPVAGCSVTGCGYNHDVTCHAGSITTGGDHAHCGTFIDISTKGGFDVQGTWAHVTARSAGTTPRWSATPTGCVSGRGRTWPTA
jgi:hypothetical protein